jgi:hypothetical protein
MQKFTIFTVIFSVIVISITTELVIQDYLQKIYPPANVLQANSLSNDFGVYYEDNTPVEPKPKTEEIQNETPIDEITTDEDLKDRTERVKEILDNRRGTQEEPEQDTQTSLATSIRVKTLLPALTIEGVQLQE